MIMVTSTAVPDKGICMALNFFVILVSKFDQDNTLSTAATNVTSSDVVRPFNNNVRICLYSHAETILSDFEKIYLLIYSAIRLVK